MEPIIARKTWRTVEPIHGAVYFAGEAAEIYGALGLRKLRHIDLAARAEQHVERIDAHEHHQRANDQQRRDAEPATASDRNPHSAAGKSEAAAIFAAAIFNVGTFTVVLVVAHGRPIVDDRVPGSNSAADINVRSATPADSYCTGK